MTCRLTQNSFDPLLTSNGQPYHRVRYKQIIEEQVTLGYLTKGGVSYGDTEQMTPYERKIALDVITDILKQQNDSVGMSSSSSPQSKDPKSALTSGVKV